MEISPSPLTVERARVRGRSGRGQDFSDSLKLPILPTNQTVVLHCGYDLHCQPEAVDQFLWCRINFPRNVLHLHGVLLRFEFPLLLAFHDGVGDVSSCNFGSHEL